MFNIAVNNLVQSIGKDVYLPSPSTAASKNLAPLSLVERKAHILPFDRLNKYYSTDFDLEDVMSSTGLHVKVEQEEIFCTFNRESKVKADRLLRGYVKHIFDAGVRYVDEITIKAELGQLSITEVDIQSLLDSVESSNIEMSHPLVKELSKKRRRALCVVTGVVRTTTPTTISATLGHKLTTEVSALHKPMEKLKEKMLIGGKLKGTHEQSSVRTMSIPAGTTLAYELMELAVDERGVMRLMVSHDAKGGFNLPSLRFSEEISMKVKTRASKKDSKKHLVNEEQPMAGEHALSTA